MVVSVNPRLCRRHRPSEQDRWNCKMTKRRVDRAFLASYPSHDIPSARDRTARYRSVLCVLSSITFYSGWSAKAAARASYVTLNKSVRLRAEILL